MDDQIMDTEHMEEDLKKEQIMEEGETIDKSENE